MARDLEKDAVYVSQGGKMPIKWTAPEVSLYVMLISITATMRGACMYM